MIIVVSGEGATDMGRCGNGAAVCEAADYLPGPMGWFVVGLVEPIWRFSPWEAGSMVFVSEEQIDELSRKEKIRSLPGKKGQRDTGYFFKNAYALARYAKSVEPRRGPTMAVLFRDADGTRSTEKGLWSEKHRSMTRGFEAANYSRGVPMLPRPKSEAWLLCALQATPYQDCARFERISGNDASPNSAKKQLAAAQVSHPQGAEDVGDLVIRGVVDVMRIDMPSFNEFRDRIAEVARAMLSEPGEPGQNRP